MSKLKLTIVVPVLTVSLIALYSLYWWSLALSFEQTFKGWLEARAGNGYVASAELVELGGFPSAISLSVEGLHLGGKTGDEAEWAWKSRQTKISSNPWQPNQYQIALSGDQNLRFLLEGVPVVYQGSANSVTLETSIDFEGYPTKTFLSLVGLNLISSNEVTPISVGTLKLNFKRLPSKAKDSPAMEIAFEAEGVSGPNILMSPFGGTFKRVVFSARQVGNIENQRPLISQIVEWRDKGGFIEVDHLALDHGPVVLSANGTVALDQEMQPLGSFTSRTFGFFEAVDVLRSKGLIKSKDATMIKLVLGVVSKTTGDGERRRLDLPISVQNRSVYTGPIRLVGLAPVDWSFVKTLEAMVTP
ncbi:MAG: DUF2125 domain-containing protein [Rhodospirillales bacterium]|nr:DUF2125 domain-containing protein [Rhodospirillales bacterium]